MPEEGNRAAIRPPAGYEPEAEVAEDPQEAGDATENESQSPKVSDLKEVWVEHAVAQGDSREDAEAMTKGDLIERHGDLFNGW